jgi:tetratricopeptide (TPR) repeat protein
MSSRSSARAVLVSLLVAATTATVATIARAGDEDPSALFDRGAKELDKGQYGAAIDDFEQLADSGFVHPDASYDRGVAYLMRVRAKADRPGDLGRAAAAFEEALRLRPDDRDADAAVDAVRAEVTRRRSHHAKDTIDVRPTLDRMIVGLVSPEAWMAAAMVASILAAIGIALRASSRRRFDIAGGVIAPLALVALVVLVPLAWAGRVLRATTREGVVVTSEARLVDEAGKSLSNEPIPEAASVEVGERRGALVHVRWGGAEGYVEASSVRLLAEPDR